jgi:hypothetical protein
MKFTEVHAKCKEGIILNSDWVDTSYWNDTCSSFENKKHSIRLWIDYPNVEDREFKIDRFMFHIYKDLKIDLSDTYGDTQIKYETIQTEDINEFNKIIEQYK